MDHAVNSTPGNAGQGRTTALLVVNRNSGSSDVTLDGLVDRFGRAGIEVSAFFPGNVEEMETLIKTRGAIADFIVLGGGDGTLNGAAPALLAAMRPVGLLPMGTANDLARTLGIPTEVRQAISVILDRHIRRIDLGTVNGRPFFNAASIGFSVDVARFHAGERKRILGLLSYLLSWFDAYRTYRPFRATITCDGAVRSCRCAQLVVGNGRHYGGGMTIAEDSDVARELAALAHDRDAAADDLAEAVIARDDIPNAPNEAKELIEAAVIRVKAILNESDVQQLLEDCRGREQRVADTADIALGERLETILRQKVAALRDDAASRTAALKRRYISPRRKS